MSTSPDIKTSALLFERSVKCVRVRHGGALSWKVCTVQRGKEHSTNCCKKSQSTSSTYYSIYITPVLCRTEVHVCTHGSASTGHLVLKQRCKEAPMSIELREHHLVAFTTREWVHKLCVCVCVCVCVYSWLLCRGGVGSYPLPVCVPADSPL